MPQIISKATASPVLSLTNRASPASSPRKESLEWREAGDADGRFTRTHLIEYGVYVPSDAEAMVQLLGEVFSRHDPPAVAVGLAAPEFEEFVRLSALKLPSTP